MMLNTTKEKQLAIYWSALPIYHKGDFENNVKITDLDCENSKQAGDFYYIRINKRLPCCLRRFAQSGEYIPHSKPCGYQSFTFIYLYNIFYQTCFGDDDVRK